eukprot:COSAG02_NODE_4815_length_4944_cov_12.040867_1_plen_194_part_00
MCCVPKMKIAFSGISLYTLLSPSSLRTCPERCSCFPSRLVLRVCTPYSTRARARALSMQRGSAPRACGSQAGSSRPKGQITRRSPTSIYRAVVRYVEDGEFVNMGPHVSIDEILPRHPISLVAMDSFAPFRGGNGSGSHIDLSCAKILRCPAAAAATPYRLEHRMYISMCLCISRLERLQSGAYCFGAIQKFS